jgi:hypothetical protein
VVLLLVLPGCGEDAASADAGVSADASADAAADSAVADAGSECPVPLLNSVAGRVIDLDGTPVGGASVVMCVRYTEAGNEFFVCLPPTLAGDDGRYQVTLPERIQCATEATVRATAAGKAPIYCSLSLGDAGDFEAPEVELFPLPGEAPSWGGQDEEIAVDAGDGGQVWLTPADVTSNDGPEAVRLTAVGFDEHRPCFLPPDQDLVSLYAMEPEGEVTREGGLRARLAAGTLAPGTEVDLYLLGGLHPVRLGEDFVREGQWVSFGRTTVGDDGFIETPAGQGLPLIGWFGAVAR